MNGDVCRLCLGNENLIWIFDDKMAKNMPEIIEGTSGVQINKTDSVTQMVCSTCCQITIKMFKFKTTSIKNDKDLKAKYAGYNISQLTNSNNQTKKDIPVSNGGNNSKLANNVDLLTVPIPQKYKFAHPSIKDIIKKYPNLKLPEISLRAHFGAYITLLTDEVDDWYKEKNFSISDIEQIKRRALEYAEVQENCPGGNSRRKRRRISSEVKICTNIKNISSDKSTSTVSPNKKPRSCEDTIGKSVKSVVNPVTRANINLCTKSSDDVNSQHKENIEVNTKLKLNQRFNLNKSEVKEVKDTKATSKASKMNNNYKQDVMKSSSDNIVKPSKKPRSGSSIPLKTGLISEPSVLKMGSVLHSLLNAEDFSQKSDGEITLKSLLQGASQLNKIRNAEADTATSKNKLTDSSHKPHENENESPIIEIDDTPSENDKFQQKKLTNSHFSLFTTRPFVKKSGSDKNNSKKRVGNENLIVGEFLILSDSDDDAKTSDKCKNQNACTNSNNNVITEEVNVLNTASSDTGTELDQNISENVNKDNGNEKSIIQNINKENGNEKRDFIRSLELAPRQAVNMPDLSLLSVTEKMNTLHTCNVCDSHYNSLKELKRHLRKIHTKCPFCHKRFRNLVNREEHIKNNCARNILRFGLKKPKLELVRIDEVKDIRRKYVSAFKEIENKKTGSKEQAVQQSLEDVVVDVESLESPPQPSSSSSSPSGSNTLPTESSLGLSQQELIQQPVLVVQQEKEKSHQQQENSPERLQEQLSPEQQPLQPQQDEQPQQYEQPQQESQILQTTATTEILPSSSQTSALTQKDNLKITENYDEETADPVRELEKFLENGPVGSQQKDIPSTALNSRTDEAISNATSVAGVISNSTDIICISDDESETVNNPDNVSDSKPKMKVINNDILNNLNLLDNDTDIIERILSEAVRRRHVGGGVKICGLKDNTIIDGGSTKIKVFKNLRKHLQYYKIPIEISYSPILNVEYKYAKVPSQKKVQDAWPAMVPLDLKTSAVTTSGTPTYSIQRNITNTSSRNSASETVHPKASSSRNVISNNVFQSNLNRLERSENVAHVSQFINAQESSSHNLILTSTHNPMISAQSLNHTLTTNGPVILNNTQNVYATSTCNNYSNFIILPTPLVTTTTNATVTTLPPTQGPLPVIQSVSSGRELETSFNNNLSSQPSIRVRNLSELS